MNRRSAVAVFYAFIAAVFYALNAPGGKLLLDTVPPTMMAGFLYLGAGIGIGLLSLVTGNAGKSSNKLTKSDLPYVIGMVLLDIAAPILLMFGLTMTNASNASLLNNFEIVATTLIALFIFKEKVTSRLWTGIALITVSIIILSSSGEGGLEFSKGSILVLLATICWGFENNCTRMISSKSTYEIVFIKGIFSGLGSIIIACVMGETFPSAKYILLAMLLGFIAYGLSIFFYVRAQSVIGAAKTSAYYAVAPFIGAILSFIFLREALTPYFLVAFAFMVAGTVFVIIDTF